MGLTASLGKKTPIHIAFGEMNAEKTFFLDRNPKLYKTHIYMDNMPKMFYLLVIGFIRIIEQETKNICAIEIYDLCARFYYTQIHYEQYVPLPMSDLNDVGKITSS